MKIEEKTYQKITPEVDGNYLTTFQEGDDVKKYEGVKTMYTPSEFDASIVREISPEEHQQFLAEKEIALQQETDNAGA